MSAEYIENITHGLISLIVDAQLVLNELVLSPFPLNESIKPASTRKRFLSLFWISIQRPMLSMEILRGIGRN